MSKLCPRNNGTTEEQLVPAELRDLAHQVRRIGCGFRSDPETIAGQKSDVAARLIALASEMEGGS